MTQLRIQRKPTPAPRPNASALGPMALILAGGFAASLSLGSGRLAPADAAAQAWGAATQAAIALGESASASMPAEQSAGALGAALSSSAPAKAPVGVQEVVLEPAVDAPPPALPSGPAGAEAGVFGPRLSEAFPAAAARASAPAPARWDGQVLSLAGREWVAAEQPPVRFPAAELVTVSAASPTGAGAPAVVANKARGLASLSSQPSPYDRLYLHVGPDRYQPLRWRVRP